jgi:hypothetical protein
MNDFQHIDIRDGAKIELLGGEGRAVVLDAAGNDFFFCMNCGGAVHTYSGQLLLQGLELKNGKGVDKDGSGCIGVWGGTLEAHECYFTGNSVMGSFGGAIHARSTGDGVGVGVKISLTRCTFTGNSALQKTPSDPYSGNGGAIFLHGTVSFTATSCTFTANFAAAHSGGGAIAAWFMSATSQATLIGCSFSTSDNDRQGHNDIWRCTTAVNKGCTGAIVFACPVGSTGGALRVTEADLTPASLPPSKEVVHCAPKESGLL